MSQPQPNFDFDFADPTTPQLQHFPGDPTSPVGDSDPAGFGPASSFFHRPNSVVFRSVSLAPTPQSLTPARCTHNFLPTSVPSAVPTLRDGSSCFTTESSVRAQGCSTPADGPRPLQQKLSTVNSFFSSQLSCLRSLDCAPFPSTKPNPCFPNTAIPVIINATPAPPPQPPQTVCLFRHLVASLSSSVLLALFQDFPEQSSTSATASLTTTRGDQMLKRKTPDTAFCHHDVNPKRSCSPAGTLAGEGAGAIASPPHDLQTAPTDQLDGAFVVQSIGCTVMDFLHWAPSKVSESQSPAHFGSLLKVAQTENRLARDLDAQLDDLMQQSTTPPPELEKLFQRCREGAVPVPAKNPCFLHLLEELKCVLGAMSASEVEPSPGVPSPTGTPATGLQPKSRTSTPATSVLSRLVLVFLFALVCRFEGAVALLDHPDNRTLRNWAMSAFFHTMLHPAAQRSNSPDLTLLGKIGLSKLDAKQRKIPREVVETVLRPALQHLCSLKNLNLKLIVGLRSVVELYPTLFKEVFGLKIREILDKLADVEVMAKTFGVDEAQVHRLTDVRAMITHMLDFFQLFAATKAFSCEGWLEHISLIVLKFERIWPPVAKDDQSTACCGLRAPLCRLLCLYPAAATALLFSPPKPPTNDQFSPREFDDLFRSIMKCCHAVPLREELARRHNALRGPAVISRVSLAHFVASPAFSDLTIRVGPDKEPFQAHRVILARAKYFERMFLGSFCEASQNELVLDHFNAKSFRIVLQYLYDDLPTLDDLSLEVVINTYKEADLLGVTELQALCAHRLATALDATSWKTILEAALTTCVLGVESNSQMALLPVDTCAELPGEILLSACKSFLLANLHALVDELDWADPVIASLLGTDAAISG